MEKEKESENDERWEYIDGYLDIFEIEMQEIEETNEIEADISLSDREYQNDQELNDSDHIPGFHGFTDEELAGAESRLIRFKHIDDMLLMED